MNDSGPTTQRAVALAVLFQECAKGHDVTEIADAAKAIFFSAVAQIGEDDEQEFLRKCRDWFRLARQQRGVR